MNECTHATVCHHSNQIHMKSKCLLLLKCSYIDQILFNFKTIAYTLGVHVPVLAITRPATCICFSMHNNEMYRERNTSVKYGWSK